MNKYFRNTLMLLACLLIGSSSVWAAGDKYKIKKDIIINRIAFESTNDIANWNAKKGNLQISESRQKEGSHSLKWTWKKGDELLVDNLEGLAKAASAYAGGQPENYEPAFYPKGMYGGIKMWLYQSEAQENEMTFQIGSDANAARSNPKYKFSINLNFTGWRAVWVQFNEDALISNYSGSDTMKSMVAIPGTGASKGSIYIDHFQLLEFISYKRHSDHVFVNNKANIRSDSYEILAPYSKYTQVSVDELMASLPMADVEQIKNRLEYLMLGGSDDNWKLHASHLDKDLAGKIKKANSNYKKLQIEITDGKISGIPLFTCRDEHGTEDGQTFQTVMQNILFPLAMDYRVNGNEDSKTKVINLYAYLRDQGWAAGSAMGTVDHIIRLNSYATSLFLMRDELPEDILHQHQECLAWHTRIGNIIDCDKSKGENTDMVRGGALAKLIAILLMPEGSQKTAMFYEFKAYMDYVVAFAPGYSDTIKPDYSLFHHRGTYLNAYGVSAVNTMAMIHWLMADTDVALSEETSVVLKNTLKRQYEIAHGLDLHIGVSGRFPYKNTAIDRFMLPAYAFMSLSDQKIVDQEMAEVFNYVYKISPQKNVKGILAPALTYSGTFGTINLMVKLNSNLKDRVLPPANGNYSLPYSSLSVHRKGNWLATVKGYDKYVWDYETGHKGENNLGRYVSHGALFLFKSGSGMKGAGMEQNSGFHWAYLPGSTTKALPIDRVYYENKPTKKYKEGYHRSFTETTFARGLTAEGKNGMFAMELRDDVSPSDDKSLFDSSFRAHKSYFFFEDEIVCLGSDIYSDDVDFKTITTLFQTNIGENGISDKQTLLNGKAIGSSMSIHKKLNACFLTDAQGIHYIMPETNELILEQSSQESLKKVGGGEYQPISAPHVKAWIDHGTNPKGKAYEYLILMDATNDEAGKRLDEPGYEVIQKDAIAHIVKHYKLNSTAYAIFNAEKAIGKGLINKVDTPVMLYLKEDGLNTMLTIANPDLQLAKWNHNMSVMPAELVHKESEGSIVTLILNGNWQQAGYVPELISSVHSNGKTTIKVFCKDGKSIDVPLRKK